MQRSIRSVFGFIIASLFCSFAVGQSAVEYDIVLAGGRVMDPETKLDAVRNVGIINNRIADISSAPLKGKQVINVSGLVVAPGFIDLHVHGRTNVEQEYQLHHVRNPNIISIQEVIADAALTNAPLHIVHINSMALGNIRLALDMVNDAQKRGVDVTTELYSYTAASTSIQSEM